MVITAITVRRVISRRRAKQQFNLGTAFPFFPVLLGAGVFLSASAAQAANWDANARVSASGIYSDNIGMSLTDPQDEFITQITPVASISGEGGRVRLNADYALQSNYYEKDSGRDGANHRLSVQEQAEVVEDFFYFDSNANISQQLEQPGGLLVLDSTNQQNGKNDVRTFQLNPYIKRDLGSFARANLAYRHGWTQHESSSASDSQLSTIRATLGNGHSNTLFHWSASHDVSKAMRDGGQDSERASSTGMMSYRVLTTITAIVRGGREENLIATSNANRDGSYWSAGLRWEPGPKFSLEMTKGENEQRAILSWAPQSRTSLNLSYTDRDVGLNDSASWSGQLTHSTRRSNWSLTYSESVTNVQALVLAEQQDVFFTSPQGGLMFDPDTGQPIIVTINVFDVTDEEFLRASGQGTVSYRTGKSTLVGSVNSEVRTYEISGRESTAMGGTASWNWQAASRTSLNTSATIQRSEVTANSDPIQSVRLSLGVNRSLNNNMNTRMEVSRTESDVATTNLQAVENRLVLTFNMTF